MDVIWQRVRTTWTKASRGGAAAARRNAAPVAFLLPVDDVPLFHEVRMWERTGFEPEQSWSSERTDTYAVEVREVDGRLRVRRSTSVFEVPRRSAVPPAVYLTPGQWMRWTINYRLSGGWEGPWTYTLDTLNVGVAPLGATAFLGEPTRAVDERTWLR